MHGLKEGESLEIYTDGENRIILKKYSPVQSVNDFVEEFVENLYASNKKDIIITDNEKVIASAGEFKQNIVGKKVSMQLEDKMNKRQTEVIDAHSGFEICENIEIRKPVIIKPINVYGDILGSVIVFGEKAITPLERSMVEFGATFMSRYLEG